MKCISQAGLWEYCWQFITFFWCWVVTSGSETHSRHCDWTLFKAGDCFRLFVCWHCKLGFKNHNKQHPKFGPLQTSESWKLTVQVWSWAPRNMPAVSHSPHSHLKYTSALITVSLFTTTKHKGTSHYIRLGPPSEVRVLIEKQGISESTWSCCLNTFLILQDGSGIYSILNLKNPQVSRFQEWFNFHFIMSPCGAWVMICPPEWLNGKLKLRICFITDLSRLK